MKNVSRKISTPRVAALLLFFTSVLIFLVVMWKTSPYRLLRPYLPQFAARLVKASEFRYAADKSHLEIRIPAAQSALQEDFWIDQIPVTLSAYQVCVAQGSCVPAHYRYYYDKFENNPLYGILPVSFVSWDEARLFCQSEGGDLPTELQWNLAAGMQQRNRYPWGNSEPSLDVANFDGFYQGLTPAGWLPEGASPYGVLDMGGNIREWVLDPFISETYTDMRPAAEVKQSLLGADASDRVLKGGGSSDYPIALEVQTHQWHGKNSPGANRGFRCAYPVIE